MTIADILTAGDLERVRDDLAQADFTPGKATAGWAARSVKDNSQAADSATIERLRDLVAARLTANAVFQLAARPKRLVGPLFSRYGTGQAYGSHVDDAIMDGVRTDLAFTLFVSDPDTYDGGDLIVETSAGDEAVKLPAGHLFLYPSTRLHRVAPVTRGSRLAAAGWVRSLVRDPGQRDVLFDLDTARWRLFDRHGKTPEFDALSKCSANLMRMWCSD